MMLGEQGTVRANQKPFGTLPRKHNHLRSQELGLFDHGQSNSVLLCQHQLPHPNTYGEPDIQTSDSGGDGAPPFVILQAVGPDYSRFFMNDKKPSLYSTNFQVQGTNDMLK